MKAIHKIDLKCSFAAKVTLENIQNFEIDNNFHKIQRKQKR